MINQFMINLDRESRLGFYNAFGMLMYVAMIALFIWAVRVYRIKGKDIILLLLAFTVAFRLSPEICTILKKLTAGLIPNRNLGVAFLPFLLIFSMLVWMLKIRHTMAMDIAVPMYIGGRGICVIGCLFTGCCHGSAAPWGIYSHHAACNTVPCPIIDSLASILIVCFLMRYSKKNEYNGNGKIAACGLIAFGILRYVVDLLRDNNKILNMITIEGILGFITLCIGLIMLYILDRQHIETPRND